MFKLKEAFFPKLELPTPDSTSKILALDGLRGLAIASVLFYHCSSYFPIGWVGVDLFFVLSGFLLTGILIETKGSPIYFRSFFIKRALRILPLYYLLLTCAIIYSLTFGTPLPHYSYFFFFQNFLTTTLKSFPSGTNQLNHLWSVAVEEQFYLVLPLIVSLFQQKKLLIFLFTAVVVAIVVRAGLFLNNNIGYYVLLFSRMDALCLGSITAVMLRSNPMTLHKWTVPFLYASGAYIVICIILGGSYYLNPYLVIGGYTVIAVFFSSTLIVILSGHPHNLLQKLTRIQLLRFLGKYSFGLYMYHWPIFILGKESLQFHLQEYFPRVAAGYLTTLILTTITLVVCLISYHLFEKKFMKFRNYLDYHRVTKANKHA